MKKIHWRQINNQHTPNSSGIYAWYYTIVIGDHDINKFISIVSDKNKDTCLRKKYVSEFLSKNIFNYFDEPPYKAIISGGLKARYEGKLKHKRHISEDLIERLFNHPKTIIDVKNFLNESDFEFSRPLYIGMAKNLKSRLLKHKSLIEKYKLNSDIIDSERNTPEDLDFASRIVERKFIETNLYVVIREAEEKNSLHNILENIFNRINYPIMGRN